MSPTLLGFLLPCVTANSAAGGDDNGDAPDTATAKSSSNDNAPAPSTTTNNALAAPSATASTATTATVSPVPATATASANLPGSREPSTSPSSSARTRESQRSPAKLKNKVKVQQKGSSVAKKEQKTNGSSAKKGSSMKINEKRAQKKGSSVKKEEEKEETGMTTTTRTASPAAAATTGPVVSLRESEEVQKALSSALTALPRGARPPARTADAADADEGEGTEGFFSGEGARTGDAAAGSLAYRRAKSHAFGREQGDDTVPLEEEDLKFRKKVRRDLAYMLKNNGGRCPMVAVASLFRKTMGHVLFLHGYKVSRGA